jgi:phosphatidylserine/phosphatidylglycerophosphate/cardiolipin synthase-like enzyme
VFIFSLVVTGWVAARYDIPVITVHFSPNRDAQDAVIGEIQSAEEHIYLAMFYLSNQEIVDALVAASERGVNVVAVFDDSQRKSFRFLRHGVNLRMHGIPVRYGGRSYKMHSKFAVIDGEKVITGSYNWTQSAEEKNVEDFVIIDSKKVAKRYVHQFVEIWESSENP